MFAKNGDFGQEPWSPHIKNGRLAITAGLEQYKTSASPQIIYIAGTASWKRMMISTNIFMYHRKMLVKGLFNCHILFISCL